MEGREEGRKEGHLEGRVEGRRQVLWSLVQKGIISEEEAAKELNLSVEEFVAMNCEKNSL